MDSHVTWTTDPDTGAMMPEFDRAVTSEPLREYIKGVITNGVLPNPSTNLQVSAGTDGMTVIVSAGFCVIEGGLAIETSERTLEVTAADSTYDRIDTVVARWDSNDSTRAVDLHIKAGVPASSPTRPSLTRDGSVYELGLADVFVTKNVATITSEKITDTRYESARCGVCSSIAEWDTTTIYQQVQADLASFKSGEQAEFLTWFDYMKDQLTEDAAGQLQTEIDSLQSEVDDMHDVSGIASELAVDYSKCVSHIGMIIQSTTLDTEAKVKAIYGGTSWSKIEGRFLLGASSSYGVGTTGGSATHTMTTSEMPSHAHGLNSHTHGLNGHTHSIPALSGATDSAGSHNHTAKNYKPTGANRGLVDDGAYGNAVAVLQNTGTNITGYTIIDSAGAHTHSVATAPSTTGGNSGSTAAATGNTTSVGSGTAMNIMNPYKAVYIWERTA